MQRQTAQDIKKFIRAPGNSIFMDRLQQDVDPKHKKSLLNRMM